MSIALCRKYWKQCQVRLKEELPTKQFDTWILPLQIKDIDGIEGEVCLLAPNDYVSEYIQKNFIERIKLILEEYYGKPLPNLKIIVGSEACEAEDRNSKLTNQSENKDKDNRKNDQEQPRYRNYLNAASNFTNFVEGKSNQLAKATAIQVAGNLGKAYNPLFIYGGVGLGKTHLMQSIGNHVLKNNHDAKVLYLHSERFVSDMVKALQKNTIDDFKKFYRSLNALLLDDIQFLAGKERSQEEFFHTFNALFEGQQQIVLTCDRYPKEINGLEDRLKSRFGWGLIVAIEPPELETRMAILLSKAEQSKILLPDEVAFFIAKHIQSNVRELEGALKRVIANSHFTGKPITLEFAKDALKDLLAMHARLITVENIQKTVAEYFKIKISDLSSKQRTRSITRPRQIAMALSKELTNHSLPEIAETFGGRDHTTVIHACKKIKELIASDLNIAEDYRNLLRILVA